MNRKLYIVIVLFFLFNACKQSKKETTHPVFSAVTEAVFAPGHIEADGQFTLTAINDGYLNTVLVAEGDHVNTHQTLFVQDNATAMVQQLTASKNLQIAQQQASPLSGTLQQLQAQLKAATDKLQNDKIQLGRMERLFATQSVSHIELENAQLSYKTSAANMASIQQDIAATKISLQQGVINSKGQLQTAVLNTGYYNIQSPGNYEVYAVFKRKGDLVRRGEGLAVLGNNQVMKAILTIDESCISKVKINQKVLIEFNTQKGKIYTGHISKIYPAFDESLQAYKAEALFDTPSSSFINGTLLQANIIVAQKENALLIPRNYINADRKVWVKNKKRTDTVMVKTGIMSTDWVEIISGVKPQDILIKQY